MDLVGFVVSLETAGQGESLTPVLPPPLLEEAGKPMRTSFLLSVSTIIHQLNSGLEQVKFAQLVLKH